MLLSLHLDNFRSLKGLLQNASYHVYWMRVCKKNAERMREMS
jgi:hypothetical protein